MALVNEWTKNENEIEKRREAEIAAFEANRIKLEEMKPEN
jgi:hypothetical protein